MEYTNIENDSIEIKKAIKKNHSFTAVFPYINHEAEVFISEGLKVILEEINQEKLFSHLEYSLNELSMNASKANLKRLYFLSENLDISDPSDYSKGMADFKEQAINNFQRFASLHYEKGLFVKIELSVDGNNFSIRVTNGCPLMVQEKERIGERIKSARKFENLNDVLTHGFDTTEGGGFGLIIMILMLRKINLDEKAIKFSQSETRFQSSLHIPLNLISQEQGDIVAQEIVQEISQMPQFPKSIVTLQKELSRPGCTFESVADTINSDSTLTAEILRIANSPVYMIRNKVTDIAGAVRLIGMLGVKSVLYNYGVNKVLRSKYNQKVVNEINDHSFNVALIASLLARYKKLGRIAEDIYVAALLHDMGKIIVKSLKKDLEHKIALLCRDKHIPISILDDLTDGYNHALIGAKVAQKWDFPEKFINVISHHHLPLEVNEEYKVLTYAVYLSNEIYYMNRGERSFNNLNHHVLSFFGLQQEEKFQDFLKSILAEGFGY